MKAGIFVRVSTTDQNNENQLDALRELAKRRGYEVVKEYETEASAYKGNHQAAITTMLEDARLGKIDVLLVWALDRVSRQGPLDALQLVDKLSKYGVSLVSMQEGWLEASGELRDVMLSIVAWVSHFESKRRSERIKAGLARLRAEGKPTGRQKGAVDRKKRSRAGYYARWERERNTA